MNYFELRDLISKIIPRKSPIEDLEKHLGLVKEKGRKTNYRQFNLENHQMELYERNLNKEEMTSFVEVSLRAMHCPMPLNADVWDGLRCGYACRYCFADSFRASLYTSFFDNTKNMGLRHCRPEYFRPELDKLMKFAGQRNEGVEVQRAIGMKVPIRLGIRFEDFLPVEGKRGISLDFLKYLSDVAYPVMINTKSDLIGREDYVRVLADNKGGSAVHITMITSDEILSKSLEPGAPSFRDRIQAVKNLTDAGIRVVARIEPFMPLINDQKDYVDEWIGKIIESGARHVTLDTYSWSATAPGIRRQMEMTGVDYDRMFLIVSDSQWLGSILLSKFIEYLRGYNLSCSTFDFGNVPTNDQTICCEVGDLYEGFSWGNNVCAIRFITERSRPASMGGLSPKAMGKAFPVYWYQFDEFVEEKGGWLSDSIRNEVWRSWNLEGNPAFNLDWGLTPIGYDGDGNRIWIYRPEDDFREELLKGLLKLA